MAFRVKGKQCLVTVLLCLGMSSVRAEEKSMIDRVTESAKSAWYSMVDTVNGWFEKKPESVQQPNKEVEKSEAQKL